MEANVWYHFIGAASTVAFSAISTMEDCLGNRNGPVKNAPPPNSKWHPPTLLQALRDTTTKQPSNLQPIQLSAYNLRINLLQAQKNSKESAIWACHWRSLIIAIRFKVSSTHSFARVYTLHKTADSCNGFLFVRRVKLIPQPQQPQQRYHYACHLRSLHASGVWWSHTTCPW